MALVLVSDTATCQALSGLTHLFIVAWFPWGRRPSTAQLGLPLRGQKAAKWCQLLSRMEHELEECASQLFQVIKRIYVPVVMKLGPRFLAGCWLSATLMSKNLPAGPCQKALSIGIFTTSLFSSSRPAQKQL